MKRLVTIHTTATPASRVISRRDIDLRDRRAGFLRIGYHYLIRRDGLVEAGRAEHENSPHDFGEDIRSAVSVCLVGGADAKGKPQDNFTAEQKSSLITIINNREIKSVTPSLSEDVVLSWKGQ